MIRIEVVLSALAVILAWLIPKPLAKAFQFVKSRADILAARRTSCVILVGVLAIVARLAALPVEPIPVPTVGDEFSYLLMSDTFAHGRIANPTHPMWIHFETFHVNQRPTYVSKYFPAQGVFLAFGQAVLGQAFWGVVLSSALMCAAICWMLQGWIEPGWALMGGILAVIRLATFSYWNDSYYGGAVTALGGALVLGALPRIKKDTRLLDVCVMSVGIALLFNSRPFESLFTCAPIFLSLILCANTARNSPAWPRVTRATALFAVLLTALAGLMCYYFWRTTGNPLTPPYVVNRTQYDIRPLFPWSPLLPSPQYHHAVMRNYFTGWETSQYFLSREHPVEVAILRLIISWAFYLGLTLSVPFMMLLFALPRKLLRIAPMTKLAIVICIATMLGTGIDTVFNPHYAAAITCLLYLFVVKAVRYLSGWSPAGRPVGVASAAATAVACVLLLPIRFMGAPLKLELHSQLNYWAAPSPQLTSRAQIISDLEKQDAKQTLLVRYSPDHDPLVEWVYNNADIDRSRIVWARDMGPEKNQELLEYYKDRKVWLVEPDENPVRIRPYPVSDADANPPSPHP